MKYKYCILTEERAKEIDKLDVVDNRGRAKAEYTFLVDVLPIGSL